MTAGVREPIILASGSDAAVAGFGVASGWAHETPRLRGVTERAMQWLAATPGVTAHWQVDALVTYFWVTGSPRNVRIGLADVFRQAGRPLVPAPLTDTSSRPDPDATLLLRRWGLRGFGLQGWPRLGFVAADADDIAAVLARIGPRTVQLFAVNAEVDPAVVPDNDAAPAPDPDFPPLVGTPVLFDGGGGFAMSWHLARRDAVAEGLVRLALAEAIAGPGAGPGAGAGAGPAELDAADSGHWINRQLGSQGSHTAVLVHPGMSDEAMAHLADRLRRWTILGPEPADLERAVSSTYEARPRSSWDVVRSAVEDSLVGSAEEGLDEPSVEAARESLSRILDSLVVVAPELSAAVRLAEVAVVPAPDPVAGDEFRYVALIRRGERRRATVTAGDQGVALRDAAAVTAILRPDVVAVEGWPGGQLRVTSVDGRQLLLDPAEIQGGERLSQHVRGLAPHAVVEHPAPRPASAALVRAYVQAGGWALTASVLLTPAVMLAALLLLGAASESSSDRVGYALVGLVFAALAGLAALRVVRLRRAGRAVGLGAFGRPRSTTVR